MLAPVEGCTGTPYGRVRVKHSVATPSVHGPLKHVGAAVRAARPPSQITFGGVFAGEFCRGVWAPRRAPLHFADVGFRLGVAEGGGSTRVSTYGLAAFRWERFYDIAAPRLLLGGLLSLHSLRSCPG